MVLTFVNWKEKLSWELVYIVGIGYHTAYDFTVRNARVILACRNTEKGEKAARHIRRETKNQNIVVKKLDLNSLKSVRDFTADIIQNEHRLDILVNNAGVVGMQDNFYFFHLCDTLRGIPSPYYRTIDMLSHCLLWGYQ